MSFDYTSVHARVFEGVRTARVRALAESRIQNTEGKESCAFDGAPAVSLWVHPDTGNISPVCRQHLTESLDGMDETIAWEPPILIPLRGRRPVSE